VLTSFLSDVDVLVIGAGPTGLGAAKRLQQVVSRIYQNIKVQNITQFIADGI
jgi:ribulose 1,5-bisphosphate synthetase/thiazole synthase